MIIMRLVPIKLVFLLLSWPSPSKYPKKLFEGPVLSISSLNSLKDRYRKLRLWVLEELRWETTNYLSILFFHFVILNCSEIMLSIFLQLFSLPSSLPKCRVALLLRLRTPDPSALLLLSRLFLASRLPFSLDCFLDTISLLWHELGLV